VGGKSQIGIKNCQYPYLRIARAKHDMTVMWLSYFKKKKVAVNF